MRIRLSNCKLVFALKTDLGSLRWNQVSLTFWFVQTARFGIKQLGYSRRRPPPQCVKKKKQRHNDKMHRSCGGALFTLYQVTRRSPVILTLGDKSANSQSSIIVDELLRQLSKWTIVDLGCWLSKSVTVELFSV